VISLTFEDVRPQSCKDALAGIRAVIAAEIERHRYLLDSGGRKRFGAFLSATCQTRTRPFSAVAAALFAGGVASEVGSAAGARSGFGCPRGNQRRFSSVRDGLCSH
jgi:hypothetical protein